MHVPFSAKQYSTAWMYHSFRLFIHSQGFSQSPASDNVRSLALSLMGALHLWRERRRYSQGLKELAVALTREICLRTRQHFPSPELRSSFITRTLKKTASRVVYFSGDPTLEQRPGWSRTQGRLSPPTKFRFPISLLNHSEKP